MCSMPIPLSQRRTYGSFNYPYVDLESIDIQEQGPSCFTRFYKFIEKTFFLGGTSLFITMPFHMIWVTLLMEVPWMVGVSICLLMSETLDSCDNIPWIGLLEAYAVIGAVCGACVAIALR